MNLIVRVKRRRTQEPSESICIIDDAGAPTKKRSTARQLADRLSAMSTSNVGKEQSAAGNKKLFLRRIQTVEVGGEAELDKSSLSISVSISQKRERDESELPSRNEVSESVVNVAQIITPESTNAEKKSVPCNTDQGSSMWITSKKKVLRSNYTLEKFVVVDVTQIPFSRPSLITSSTLSKESHPQGFSTTVLSPASLKKSAVIDPATRKLETAIEKAYKFNDFNDMAQALQIGANINHQRTSDGLTALMVACAQKNNRMVSRLVAKGADIFLLDSNGRSAMDHVKKGHNQSHTGNSHLQNASVEISLLLHRTAVSAQQVASRRQRRSDEEEDAMRNLGESANPYNQTVPSPDVSHRNEQLEEEESKGGKRGEGEAEGDVDDSDYVVDIFMQSDDVNGSLKITAAAATATGNEEGAHQELLGNKSSSSMRDFEPHIPVVQVEGLQISGNGNVELVFEYDSDWSDLADDEEPDSNDERFAGNDYPEEGEEGEDAAEEEDEDSEDDEKYAMLRADIEDRHEGGYERRHQKKEEDIGDMEGLSYGFSGGNGSSRRINRFNRNSVGRVLRPHMMDETGEGGALMSSGRDPQALQQLWGLNEETGNDEDDDYEDDEDEDDDNVAVNSKFRAERAEKNQRIKGMRAGTGMQFAADPREFSRSGLPKYGIDLSDDETELEPYEYALEDENKSWVTSVKFAEGTKKESLHKLYGQDNNKNNEDDHDDNDDSNNNNNNNNEDDNNINNNSNVINMITSDHTGRYPCPTTSTNTAYKQSNLTATVVGKGGGGGGRRVGGGGGLDALSMIRNEVRETNAARARGDLTGDLHCYQNRGNTSTRAGTGTGGRGQHDLFRPLRTTVAYDSDLDMESSDEDSI